MTPTSPMPHATQVSDVLTPPIDVDHGEVLSSERAPGSDCYFPRLDITSTDFASQRSVGLDGVAFTPRDLTSQRSHDCSEEPAPTRME